MRTLGGLSTEEVARAFLTPVPTKPQRLVRAQRMCEDAIGLGRTLVSLLDALGEDAAVRLFRPEAMGLLALMRLHHARRRARLSPQGALVLLEAQDRR